jgi:glycosyltransferase involved in cell wall biosynthesis
MISKTICSILEQTHFDFEIIVVDDGSTDNTEQVLAVFRVEPRFKYFKMQNSERGAARNLGVRQASADYVTFLDSDDILLPWHLATAAQFISERGPERPSVFHLAYEILHQSGKIDALPRLPSPVNDKLLEGNYLSCMGVFLRKDIALDNRFDEDRNLSGSEDYELWMRLAARYPILTCPVVTSRLIHHDNRSVVTTDTAKLMTRISLLDQKLLSDNKFVARFGDRISLFTSYRSLYLALHLVMSGERWLALKTLIFTAGLYPNLVLSYRFNVILKKILLW